MPRCFYWPLGCTNQVKVEYDICQECFDAEHRQEAEPRHWQTKRPDGVRPICVGCRLMVMGTCKIAC